MIVYDFQKVCLDIFPESMSLDDKTLAMIEAADIMEKWLHRHTSFQGSVRWVNVYDAFENPNLDIGFFRAYREDPPSAAR